MWHQDHAERVTTRPTERSPAGRRAVSAEGSEADTPKGSAVTDLLFRDALTAVRG
jgi:hypothetical protein